MPDESIHSITVWLKGDCPTGDPVITEPDKFVQQIWTDLDHMPSPLFMPWTQLLTGQYISSIKDQLDQTNR
jgi:8-oxo-dGTP diphosphatase